MIDKFLFILKLVKYYYNPMSFVYDNLLTRNYIMGFLSCSRKLYKKVRIHKLVIKENYF